MRLSDKAFKIVVWLEMIIQINARSIRTAADTIDFAQSGCDSLRLKTFQDLEVARTTDQNDGPESCCVIGANDPETIWGR